MGSYSCREQYEDLAERLAAHLKTFLYSSIEVLLGLLDRLK
jgi:hypothetical protein